MEKDVYPLVEEFLLFRFVFVFATILCGKVLMPLLLGLFSFIIVIVFIFSFYD